MGVSVLGILNLVFKRAVFSKGKVMTTTLACGKLGGINAAIRKKSRLKIKFNVPKTLPGEENFCKSFLPPTSLRQLF